MIATWFKNIAREREFSAFSLLRFPFFLAVLLSNFSFKYFRHSLVLNWSKFPSSEDTRPAADEWKHQFQFIFQYQWISARSMALVSMFLCNQSYASHGRDFLLGARGNCGSGVGVPGCAFSVPDFSPPQAKKFVEERILRKFWLKIDENRWFQATLTSKMEDPNKYQSTRMRSFIRFEIPKVGCRNFFVSKSKKN